MKYWTISYQPHDLQPGQALIRVGDRFASEDAAADFLDTSPEVDPCELAAGHYTIDGPDEE